MNKVPIISGHNSLLEIVAEVLDDNGVKFNWVVLSPDNGLMEPAIEDQYKKFEQIVGGLQYHFPNAFRNK